VALAPYEAVATERQRRSSMANAARVRGRLEAARGSAEKAEAAFASALAHVEDLPVPFFRGLIELDYGAFLPRAGKRRNAAALLNAARGRFEDLPARPYLARAEWELAACGLAPARRGGSDPERLTHQELAWPAWWPQAAPTARWRPS
jgi:hypothetical protein